MKQKPYNDIDLLLILVSAVLLPLCIVLLIIGIIEGDRHLYILSAISFLIHYLARCLLIVKRSDIMGGPDEG